MSVSDERELDAAGRTGLRGDKFSADLLTMFTSIAFRTGQNTKKDPKVLINVVSVFASLFQLLIQ